MKVLWLCSAHFSDVPIKKNGTWYQPLAESLSAKGVNLINVSQGNVKSIKKSMFRSIVQYTIPTYKPHRHGNVPDRRSCEIVARLVETEKPDLIHVWGTESIWAYMKLRGVFGEVPALLDIQGILSSSSYYYYGGLSFTEILKCIHLKEILMPWRTLFFKKREFKLRGENEIKSIESFDYISYQSEWVKNQISFINSHAKLFFTRIALRNIFYESPKWEYHCDIEHPIVFSICSEATSYKGIHVLLKAVNLLKQKYPNIELRIAGVMYIGNLLKDGYSIYLGKLIRKLDLMDNVTLVGPIDDAQIVNEELNADVCVIPSFIETYCLSLAEAMMLGCPTVVSYTGALPFTSNPNSESLFYNSVDYAQCAANIERLFIDKEKALLLSRNSIEHRSENKKIEVVETQINIYKHIINAEH